MVKRFKLVCQMLIIKTFSNLKTRFSCIIGMVDTSLQEVFVGLITRIFQKAYFWQTRSFVQHVVQLITLKMDLSKKDLQCEIFRLFQLKFELKRYRPSFQLTFLHLQNEN